MREFFGLSGEVALVTGGSRGLGKAIALGLAKAGADVVVSSRSLSTCEAVAGEIGSVNKMEYTVLGDTVNTASRLESGVAKPGQVVVGELTRTSAGDAFDFEELGTFSLKGKENEVPAFEVRSRLGGEGPETVAPVPPEANGGTTGP